MTTVPDQRLAADGTLPAKYATSEMLPSRWAVHDVPSVETLCRGVLCDLHLDRTAEPRDLEELLAWMLGEVVILLHGDPHAYCSRCAYRVPGQPLPVCPRCASRVWRKPVVAFDPERGVPFRLYAYGKLRQRLIDHLRSWRGRRGQKAIIDTRAADTAARDGGVDDGAPGAARLDEAALGAGDEACRADAREWLHPERDRHVDRPVGGVGDRGDRSGAGRDPRPSSRATRRPPSFVAGAGGDVPAPWTDCRCGHRNYLQPPNGRPDWHLDVTCGSCGAALLELATEADTSSAYPGFADGANPDWTRAA